MSFSFDIPAPAALWDSVEADIVTGGKSEAPWLASGVCLNIHELQHGDLFLASKGDDLSLAIAKGASVIGLPQGVEMNCKADVPTMRVGSAFTALQSLASAARFRTHACVISVQGRQARHDMERLLSRVGHVHCGDKHVSLGLANLPEDADYGIFSASPVVKPDIVVITSPETASRDTLFEHMNPHGAVLINADGVGSGDSGFVDTLARAKAAGIESVYIYGRHKSADAFFVNYLPASNGLRVTGLIAGEGFSLNLGTSDTGNSMILPALCILAMKGRDFGALIPQEKDPALQHQDEQTPLGTNETVKLLDEPLAEGQGQHAVMRVKHIVDRGSGRQMAMLDHLRHKAKEGMRDEQDRHTVQGKKLKIPYRFAHFDLVHRSRRLYTVRSAYNFIRARYHHGTVEKVAPDSIAPGDFLVFREIWNSPRTKFSEALRLVSDTNTPQDNDNGPDMPSDKKGFLHAV